MDLVDKAEAWDAVIATHRKYGWQPIETAPKDGTVIDIWTTTEWDHIPQRFTSCWWWKPGHESAQWRGIPHDPMNWVPTHWMPLPEPPQEKTP